jgi:hypothetical protein
MTAAERNANELTVSELCVPLTALYMTPILFNYSNSYTKAV